VETGIQDTNSRLNRNGRRIENLEVRSVFSNKYLLPQNSLILDVKVLPSTTGMFNEPLDRPKSSKSFKVVNRL
jgi:hypothetical protein